MEILEKKCPRCGGTSANSSNPSGRCKACLAKLASNKKKPGHWQRAQTKADDALRRQKGKNGTAHKKSKGLGTRKSIVKQTKAAERKTGQKLSPDRKNNSEGYASSNTRMVPEKLNRGRHHVDGKKLRAWQRRLKKSDTDADQFYTYLLAKAHETNDTALLALLEDMHPNDVTRFIENEDTDETLKKSEELAKEAAQNLPSAPEAPKASGLASEVGKTHTLEIHPDIDHLYRAKGLMAENKKDKLHINEFKKNGQFGHILDKLPKDAKGYVTPEGIDKHIESLPKHKVNVRVLEGKNRPGEQKHRRDAPEYTLSMDMHPEHKMKMDPKHRRMWDRAKTTQHSWEKDGAPDRKELKDLDQVGWVRVDPNKHNKEKGFEEHPHWHIDEVQSDFQNPKKIKNVTPEIGANTREQVRNHPEYNATREAIDKELDDHEGQDTPLHDAQQDHENDMKSDWLADQDTYDIRERLNTEAMPRIKEKLADGTHGGLQDPHLKSAYKKLGPEAMEHFTGLAGNGDSAHAYEFGNREYDPDIEEGMREHHDPKVVEAIPKWKSLSPEEKKSMASFLENHATNIHDEAQDQISDRWDSSEANNGFRHGEAHDRILAKDPDFFKKPESITDKDRQDLLEHLSHGHDDPQHALHSAANALGRKLGVKSMSMDTPEDQAKKSVLRTDAPKRTFKPHPPEKTWEGWHNKLKEHMGGADYKHDPESWSKTGQPLVEQLANENDDFKSVANKLGPKGLEAAANLIPKNDDGWMYQGEGSDWEKKTHPDDKSHPELDNEVKSKMKDLSPQERDELSSFLNMYRGKLHENVAKQIGLPNRPEIDAESGVWEDDPDAKKPELPVHQINTYNKRPKKLGMKQVDKKQVLGDHPEDKADHKIQYMNLHKKLAALKHYLEELKKQS